MGRVTCLHETPTACAIKHPIKLGASSKLNLELGDL